MLKRTTIYLALAALLLCVALVGVVSGAPAGTISVDVNDVGCVTGTGQADPYAVVYCNISDAVVDAAAGDTINVAAGTYAETVTIPKALELLGAQAGNPPNGRTVGSVAESIIDATGLQQGVVIKASDVTVDGFDILGDGGTYAGLLLYPTNSTGDISTISIANNFVHGMGLPNPSSSYYVTSYGVLSIGEDVAGTRKTVTDLAITDNAFSDLGGVVSGGDTSAGAGVWLYSVVGATAGDGATISGNSFADMDDGYNSGTTAAEFGVAVAVIDDGDAVPDGGADVSGNTYANASAGVSVFATNSSVDELGSDFSAVPLLVLNVGNLATVAEANLAPYARSDAPTGFASSTAYFASVKDAIDNSDAAANIDVTAGAFAEGPQIHVTKNVTVSGAGMGSTILNPTANTGSSGDARGWFLVDSGVTFDLSDMTLDGTGFLVYQGLRHKGAGAFDSVEFKEIKYQESGPTYGGVAIAAFGDGPVDVTNSTFSQIGRVGVLYWVDGNFSSNSYTGKGVGDWIDYAIDANAGANVVVDDITVSGNRGVASSDGSTSAALLFTTFSGAGTTGNVSNSDLSDNTTGILVGYNGSDTSTVTAANNCIYDNDTGISTTAPAVAADTNWWGDASGPNATSNPAGTGNPVDDGVDFEPWITDGCGGSAITGNWVNLDSGLYDDLQSLLDSASSGDTIQAAGDEPLTGGGIVNTPGITIDLNGKTAGPGSPFLIVNAANTTVLNGTLNGGGSPDPAILVQSGGDNFILQDVEVMDWANGVQVAASVTSFKLVSNWFHDNANAGLQVDSGVVFGGIVTIEGNLFKENFGPGVSNDSGNSLDATYNSWGDLGGPAVGAGDGVSADVVYTPWTFSEPYLDVDPDSDAIQRDVAEDEIFNVKLKADAANLYGISFKFTYDTDLLTYGGVTFSAPWAGQCVPLIGLAPDEIGYRCNLITGPEWNGGDIATFEFTADLPGILPGDEGPWQNLFDIESDVTSTSSAAIGGVKVFVNNAGYGDPSDPDRDITDYNDGQIDIDGLANFTGFVNLQGRANDGGATLTIYDQMATSGATALASGLSVSSGQYTTVYIGANQLLVDETYWLQFDADLFLPTTVKYPSLATNYADSAVTDDRPLTTLLTAKLLGGDAFNDDYIDVSDASCIGGFYGTATAACGGGSPAGSSPDVNIDGIVDILDLALMGGNYTLTSSPWTAQ